MQGLHAEESRSQLRRLFGQYLDLGVAGPDIRATSWALQAAHLGADGRQWKTPVLALLGAPKVKHQTAAAVG